MWQDGNHLTANYMQLSARYFKNQTAFGEAMGK